MPAATGPAATAPFVVLARDGTMLHASPAARDLLGPDGLALSAPAEAALRQALADPVFGARVSLLTDRGLRLDAILAPQGDDVALLLRDAGEEERTARELLMLRENASRTEKLAAMGSLVTGVAHEVRTPLAYIRNNLYLLQMRLADRPDLDPFFRGAEDGVQRIGAIVETLRKFVRLDPAAQETGGLETVVAEALKLLEVLGTRGAALETDLRPTAPVRMNILELQQVVLNLVENAIEASPPGGRVVVRTQADPPAIVVDDAGPGVEPEEASRIFEALYTTKPTGTGLGLSIVRRIAERHGGRVEVARGPLGGARFTASFPRAGKAED